MRNESTTNPSGLSTEPPRLRAIVEICGAELAIFPIATSDADEHAILDALRFVIADGMGDER
jgi:hypothetical protein